MNGEILTPASPRWVDFSMILTSSPYLDFHIPIYKKQSRPKTMYWVDAGMAWYCPHNKDKPFAHEALRELGGVDVAATLAQWPDLCDCGLVFELGNEEEE